jgi:hypothetical protein
MKHHFYVVKRLMLRSAVFHNTNSTAPYLPDSVQGKLAVEGGILHGIWKNASILLRRVARLLFSQRQTRLNAASAWPVPGS